MSSAGYRAGRMNAGSARLLRDVPSPSALGNDDRGEGDQVRRQLVE
ncbi:MAG: hypothetical protein JWL79_3853, partial [Frankiales bacterium]|nr:hypothetical protein [Frankiales bacterium]